MTTDSARPAARADRYARLSQRFADLVAGVPDDVWQAPTPCPDWTVRELVSHVVESPAMFEQLVGRTLHPHPPVDDDPLAAMLAVREQVLAELRDPDTAEAPFEGHFGPSTFGEAVDRFVCFDLVVHGWDLARATGQDDTIDAGEVDRLWQDADLFGPALRSEGVCGPAVEPPAGADEQTRLLAHLGRRP